MELKINLINAEIDNSKEPPVYWEYIKIHYYFHGITHLKFGGHEFEDNTARLGFFVGDRFIDVFCGQIVEADNYTSADDLIGGHCTLSFPDRWVIEKQVESANSIG